MSLRELEVDPTSKAIEETLAEIVNDLIEESRQEQLAAPADELSEPLGPEGSSFGAGQEREFRLPLIRLRVDYTGYSTIHSQRFGQQFVNKVANPNDILLWSKSAAKCASMPMPAVNKHESGVCRMRSSACACA